MAKQAKLTLLIDLADKLSGKLGKLEGKVTKFQEKAQGKLNKLADRFSKKIGISTENLKQGLMVGAVAGFAALSTLAYKGVDAAQKFDSAFLPIKNLNLDKSKGELDAYRSKIRDATFEVGTNLEASTNAMYDLQSATGLYGDKAVDVFKKVGRYSIATGANINDAMNSTTKAMKAFGLGVNDIDKLLESNAKTVQVGITTFDELAKVQTEYAGAASSAGQGIDQANKVFAMFTSVAKNSDVGANMAKTFFQGLGQQADKFEDVLKVNVFDKNGSMRNADAILKDISGRFKNMTDKEITDAINKIGGPEGLRGALDKVKTGADDMIATFNAFDSSQFSLEEALKNAEGDFTTMKAMFSNRLEAVFSKIGEKILPMLANLFDKLNPALEWLYNNMDWLLPVLGTFVTVLGAVTGAIWLLNTAMFANPVGLIIAGVAALIALIVYLCSKIEGWGDLWDNTVSLISSVWNGFLTDLKVGWLTGEDLLLSGIEKITKAWYKMKSLWDEESAKAGLAQIEQQSAERAKALNKTKELSLQHKMNSLERLDKVMNSLSWKEDKEEKKQKSNSLYTGTTGAEHNRGKRNNPISNSIQKVTRASTAAKNINIKIDALHKGDNNLSGENGRRMSMKEYEAMFEEMMMRIIRNAELS